jgi:hypothetical protein
MPGHSIVSQHFMEPEGSKPNSQELSTCFYPESDQSSPLLLLSPTKQKEKQNLWPESVSELYRPSGHRLLAKLVLTFAYGGCHVVSVTDPYGRILGFLDRSRDFFFQVAPQLYSRG